MMLHGEYFSRYSIYFVGLYISQNRKRRTRQFATRNGHAQEVGQIQCDQYRIQFSGLLQWAKSRPFKENKDLFRTTLTIYGTEMWESKNDIPF